MTEKSRGNGRRPDRNPQITTGILYFIVILALLYTRFINLGWGLPYPFHPDERNMADALMKLHCTALNSDCFNPHFFAYGQLPLYLGYAGTLFYHLIRGFIDLPITFTEAVISLRFISASASVFTFFILMKLLDVYLDTRKNYLKCFLAAAVFIFSPALIQFAHFGTTESLLMLFYTAVVYISALLLTNRLTLVKYGLISGVLCGAALATKSSAFSFISVPLLVLFYYIFVVSKDSIPQKILSIITSLSSFWTFVLVTAFTLSPYNFIDSTDFLNSMQYESSVGLGKSLVFYTRQFQMTIPILFQFTSIFPYVLGLLITFLFIGGFIFLKKSREINLLRLSFLLYFLPSAVVFTKWTRFMAPIFPIMLLIAVLFIFKVTDWLSAKFELSQKKELLKKYNSALAFFVLLTILPGIAFTSIYRKNDIRFTASDWIYKHIPADSVILSETANVVDLPMLPPTQINRAVNVPAYHVISFNSYDVDENPELVETLKTSLKEADYIIVPSRRVFANHTCLQKSIHTFLLKSVKCPYLSEKYPILNDYYEKLFADKLGFVKVKEFSGDPSINFGPVIWKFQDEIAEETWSVFDHPTIRIYKKVRSFQTSN
ncbi:MAG: hypothetical protein ABIO02_02745, partial [Patescibacteria group bacterium]